MLDSPEPRGSLEICVHVWSFPWPRQVRILKVVPLIPPPIPIPIPSLPLPFCACTTMGKEHHSTYSNAQQYPWPLAYFFPNYPDSAVSASIQSASWVPGGPGAGPQMFDRDRSPLFETSSQK